MSATPAPQTARLTPEKLGFSNNEVQTLNALIWACLKGAEAELKTAVPIGRMRFLKEARDTCKKFLHATGGGVPDAPSGIILPNGHG